MICTCPFCEKHKRINEIVNSKNFDKMTWLIRELEDELINVQSDHDRLESILDGTWPSAREILKKSWSKLPPEEKELPTIEELDLILTSDGGKIFTFPDGSITVE